MIIKLGSGKSSGGLLRYLEQGKRQVEMGEVLEPELEHRHMAYNSLGADDIQGLERMFRATREVWNKNDGVRVHHASISMNPGDPVARSMTDEALVELGKDFMSRHAPGHDYAIFIHRDREHPHMHLAWNAVNPETGRKFQSTRSKLYDAQRYAREMEQRLGHERVLMPGDPGFVRQRDRLSDAEIHIKVRDQDAYLWKEDLKHRIETARAMASGYDDFLGRLGQMEVGVTERGQDKKLTYSFLDRDGKQRKSRGSSLGDDYTRESIEIKIGRGQGLDVLRPGVGSLGLTGPAPTLGTPGPQPGHGPDIGGARSRAPEADRDLGIDHRRIAEIAAVIPGDTHVLERAATRIIGREARRFEQGRGRGQGRSIPDGKDLGPGQGHSIEDGGGSRRSPDRSQEHDRAVPALSDHPVMDGVRSRNSRGIVMPVAMDKVHEWRKVGGADRGREHHIRQGLDQGRAHDPGIPGRGPEHEQGGADRLRAAYQQRVERNVLRAGVTAFAGDGQVKSLLRRGVEKVRDRVHRAAEFLVERLREFGRKIEIPFKVALDREHKHELKMEHERKIEMQRMEQERKMDQERRRMERGYDRGRDFGPGL